MSKKKISYKNKLNAVYLYLSGKQSQGNIASIYSVSLDCVQQWIRNYETMGVEAFMAKKNKKYSTELKVQAVTDYLSGKGSLNAICKKYKIPSKGRLCSWIKMYNGHEELKSSKSGGRIIMTKGRKTTLEERIKIVQYCIQHNHNYDETSKIYHVSYQQARNYTLKYEKNGLNGLNDNRGKRKTEDEMTEVERLRAQIKLLETEKEQAEMEVSFLKKLDEVERRWD